MRRLRLFLAILTFLIAIQFVVIGALGLILYQSTPNSVLARETIIGRLPGVLSLVRLADRASNFMYRGATPDEPLPQYSLQIDQEDYQELISALPAELPSPWYGNLYLTDESKVWANAVFTDETGEQYDVKVRVRGDIFNHWAYNKKSWRVKFSKDKLFKGMRQINFIIPEDRGWISEPLNAYRAKKLDLLHPPMQLAQVSVNGSGPLLYLEVEHWTKEMLEKQNRPGDVNIYNTGGGTSYFQQWDPAFEHIEYWDKYIEDPAAEENYDEIAELLALAKEGAHQSPQYLDRLQSIIDVDRMVNWYVLSLLAGSRHVSDFNFRVYFDTSRGLFEPLPWDIYMYNPQTLLAPPDNALLREILSVPTLRLQAYKKVWDYVNDEEEVADDLAHADKLLQNIERAAYRDPLKILSNRVVQQQLRDRHGMVKRNIDFLQEELDRSEVLITERIPDSLQQNRGVLLAIDITSRGISSANLAELHLPDALVPLLQDGRLQLWKDSGNAQWGEDDTFVALALREEADSDGGRVAETQSVASLVWPGEPKLDENGRPVMAPHTTHRFFLRVTDDTRLPDDAYPFKLDVRNAVTGNKAQVSGNVLIDERTFENLSQAFMSKEEFLDRYTFFRSGEGNEVILSGNHIVSQNVYIPATVSLRVTPGTRVRLGPNVSILSYAPVNMIGFKKSPIIFEAKRPEEPWGVFAVLNAKEPSVVQWVNFSHGSEARLNGALFTGMLAFQNSPVTIVDSVIRNAHGDDGINLKHVYADVNRVRFEANDHDGLDVDWALSGVVENSLFVNNGNDGLDISGSPIIIRNIEVRNSGDKCISVGEASAPLIYDTTLKGCAFGLAVKDDSHVKVERVLFENNDIAIGAYIKKNFFQPPSVVVTESTFRRNEENTQALSGAVITVDSAQ